MARSLVCTYVRILPSYFLLEQYNHLSGGLPLRDMSFLSVLCIICYLLMILLLLLLLLLRLLLLLHIA